MGLFHLTSCRQHDWKQFLNIHEETWLPAMFAGIYIASKLPGIGGLYFFLKNKHIDETIENPMMV